ncbi:MAG TPA: helix-turn-helix domain-containing protein [Thermoleophilaceae bacterium]|nr:helix-turn-helix domain-containing protein [Thermoleophilaceae bacterium]
MSRPATDPLGDVAAFAALGDERRRRLYDHVVAQRRPVGRDEAAEAVGIGRPLAAYHLDKLAQAGLLDVVFARPPGRSGPGAGRPAKQYVRAQRTLAAQTPVRDYEFVAQLLAETIGRADRALAESARELAREQGRRLAAELASGVDLDAELAARGYEPRRDPDGAIELSNCPFHAVAATNPELVCSLNQAFLEGLLERAGAADQIAELDPCAGRCCVTIRKPAAPGAPAPPDPARMG